MVVRPHTILDCAEFTYWQPVILFQWLGVNHPVNYTVRLTASFLLLAVVTKTAGSRLACPILRTSVLELCLIYLSSVW